MRIFLKCLSYSVRVERYDPSQIRCKGLVASQDRPVLASTAGQAMLSDLCESLLLSNSITLCNEQSLDEEQTEDWKLESKRMDGVYATA